MPPLKRILYDPWLEYALCLRLLPDRMRLPAVELPALFPGADAIGITLDRLPDGTWRTDLDDLVSLLKIVRLTSPKLVLELGSYRGVTAAYLARNVPEDGRVVAVDIDPDHGSAYRGTDLEARIERRTGEIRSALFASDERGSYDLIFIDASHLYGDLRRDTDIAMGLVAPQGYIVWHDYSNFGYFNRSCEVPEFLADLSSDKHVVNVAGSTLAIHSPAWSRGDRGRPQDTGRRSATIRP